MSALPLRIVGRRLPGRRFGEHKNVHLGVQRGQEVVDLVPGDAVEAVFEFEVNRSRTGGRTDFGGPYVHGRSSRRFLYLSWGEVGECGFEMFRRAKLHLTRINVALIDQVAASGGVLEGILSLTDDAGGPRCASVPDSVITWRVLPTPTALTRQS
jgi:Family of unknown function (DUF5990)